MEEAGGAEPSASDLVDAEKEQHDTRHDHAVSSAGGVASLWGRPGHLTESEERALREFQKAEPNVDDIQARTQLPTLSVGALDTRNVLRGRHTDNRLFTVQGLRFLRARNFDVPKALILLKESRDFAEKERCAPKRKVEGGKLADFVCVVKVSFRGVD